MHSSGLVGQNVSHETEHRPSHQVLQRTSHGGSTIVQFNGNILLTKKNFSSENAWNYSNVSKPYVCDFETYSI